MRLSLPSLLYIPFSSPLFLTLSPFFVHLFDSIKLCGSTNYDVLVNSVKVIKTTVLIYVESQTSNSLQFSSLDFIYI